jgi:hypothetical protein
MRDTAGSSKNPSKIANARGISRLRPKYNPAMTSVLSNAPTSNRSAGSMATHCAGMTEAPA